MSQTRKPRRHVPAFAPVPLRYRSGGWTPGKQAAFLGFLAATRCVRTAARHVGMSRETAYRLRRKPGAGSFAHAWNVAIGENTGPAPKVTLEELRTRAVFGLLKPLLYRGRYVSTVRKADNSALLRYLARFDRACRDLDRECRDEARLAPCAASTRSGHGAPIRLSSAA
ncbi:MAG TPA: hypothetical protein VGE05_11970 [Novosphingobium sp.]